MGRITSLHWTKPQICALIGHRAGVEKQKEHATGRSTALTETALCTIALTSDAFYYYDLFFVSLWTFFLQSLYWSTGKGRGGGGRSVLSLSAAFLAHTAGKWEEFILNVESVWIANECLSLSTSPHNDTRREKAKKKQKKSLNFVLCSCIPETGVVNCWYYANKHKYQKNGYDGSVTLDFCWSWPVLEFSLPLIGDHNTMSCPCLAYMDMKLFLKNYVWVACFWSIRVNHSVRPIAV